MTLDADRVGSLPRVRCGFERRPPVIRDARDPKRADDVAIPGSRPAARDRHRFSVLAAPPFSIGTTRGQAKRTIEGEPPSW